MSYVDDNSANLIGLWSGLDLTVYVKPLTELLGDKAFFFKMLATGLCWLRCGLCSQMAWFS